MPRIYLGRLPYKTSQRDIEKFLDGYGRIRDIALKYGFAFVEMEDRRDAEDAVRDLDGKTIAGDHHFRVQVEFAKGCPRGGDAYRYGSSPERGSRRRRSRSRSDSRGRDRKRSRRDRTRSRSRDRKRSRSRDRKRSRSRSRDNRRSRSKSRDHKRRSRTRSVTPRKRSVSRDKRSASGDRRSRSPSDDRRAKSRSPKDRSASRDSLHPLLLIAVTGVRQTETSPRPVRVAHDRYD